MRSRVGPAIPRLGPSLRDTPPTTCQGCANGGLARVTGRTAASRRGGEAPGTGAERRPGAAPGGHARRLRFFLLKKGKLGKEPHTRDAGHTRAQTPRGTPNPETCEDAEDGAGRPTGGAFLSGDRFVESWLWKHIHALRAREKRYRTDEPQSAPERGTGARGRRRNSPR